MGGRRLVVAVSDHSKIQVGVTEIPHFRLYFAIYNWLLNCTAAWAYSGQLVVLEILSVINTGIILLASVFVNLFNPAVTCRDIFTH